MASFFISYDRESRATVATLAADVVRLGHIAWFDQEIGGGRRWWDQILEKIRECDVFIFVLDPQALDSPACKSEWNYAADLGKSILPVLVSDQVDTDRLPARLAEIQFIDYLAPDRDAAIRLARALNTIPPSASLPDPLPDPPKAPVSYIFTLEERIESPDTLSYEAHSVLITDLKKSLRDPAHNDHTHRLLEMLRNRRDFLATFAEEVEELLAATTKHTSYVQDKTIFPPPAVDSSEGFFRWGMRRARKSLQNSGHRVWERVISPETRLGAALRAAIVGFILYASSSFIVGFFWTKPDETQQSFEGWTVLSLLILCGVAGGIAGKNPRATFSALAALAAMAVMGIGTVWWKTHHGTVFRFGKAMIWGGAAAILVAFIVVAWEMIRALRTQYRQRATPEK
jgi:TIR domain